MSRSFWEEPMNSHANRSSMALPAFIARLALIVLFATATIAKAEDGYRLWLRYDPLPTRTIEIYQTRVTELVVPGNSATLDAIRTELVNGCSGLLDRKSTRL